MTSQASIIKPPSSKTESDEEWHSLTPDSIIDLLATSPATGLSTEEVTKRQEKYGHNQLVEAPPTSFWELLWEQFNNFVVILLVAAALISAVLGEWVEAIAILAIVVLNAALGIVQERRAEEELAALRKLAAPDAQVLRDGHRRLISSREVVPGDIVLLEAGNYIPADVRLLESVNLRVEEAALTGESVPVQKDASILLQGDVPLGDRKNTAFMGTLVSYGRGRGVVISTGMHTQIGLIATMLQAVQQDPTPLQRRLDQLGKTLGWAALAISALVFLLGWLRGSDPLDMFLIAISLAIAAVPEGLPAVVTISLALGMREMISRNALIRRLSSVETLGSATVIGSDKTGTLTQNQMTVTRIWVDDQTVEVEGTGYAPRGNFTIDGQAVNLHEHPAVLTALWVGALNSNAELEASGASDMQKTFRIVGDPTEGAIVVAAAKADSSYRTLEQAYPRVQETPFDSERKRMTTVHQIHEPKDEDISPFYDDGQFKWHVVTVKGAPDIVLDLCNQYQRSDDTQASLSDGMRKRILEANELMAKGALRVIAVAYRVTKDLPAVVGIEELEDDLIFVGLLGMIDPPRPEVVDALSLARNAGIRTIMITGDFPQTGRAIAEAIGLFKPGHKVLTGSELNNMDDETLQREVEHTDVFARVSPEHKVRIVQALRDTGQVVAMTGDGVNDAPALKQADIGVAMGVTGTDVAKETADMVLTDDNYSSIVSAVEQGRIIYSNIRKFVYYLLSCNLAEIGVIFLATAGGLASPLNAIQLLWLNLVTDGAPALALGTEVGDPDIMEIPPRPPKEPIINSFMLKGIIVQTVAITAVTLAAYLVGLRLYPSATGEFNSLAATMAFVTLSLSELLRAFTARSERYPIIKIGVFTNKNMNWAVISSTFLLLAVVYIPFLQPIFKTTPLGFAHWIYVLPLLTIPAIAAEITKWVLSRE
ncbi:MAG: cation-translocating P-type ATPase [Chloroflexi bacterium]|nr:cation-translocating P-type ATPase [Chloroflexota bacterium]